MPVLFHHFVRFGSLCKTIAWFVLPFALCATLCVVPYATISAEPFGTESRIEFASKPRQLLNVAQAFNPQASFPDPTIRQASFDNSDKNPGEANLPVALNSPEHVVASTNQGERASSVSDIPRVLTGHSGIVKPMEEKDGEEAESGDLATEPEVLPPQTQTDRSEGDGLLDQSLNLTKGAKKDRLEKPKLTGAIAPVVSVVGSLLIVLSAFLLLALLFKRISPQVGRLLPKEAFEDLGRTAISQKNSLHLLRLGNRLILVSVTPDGVSPVTEIVDPDEVVSLLGLCRKQDANSSTTLFRKALSEVVDKESGDEDYFGAELDAKTKVSSNPRSAPTVKKTSPGPTNRGSNLNLISEPTESLADLLASGLPSKGGRHG